MFLFLSFGVNGLYELCIVIRGRRNGPGEGCVFAGDGNFISNWQDSC